MSGLVLKGNTISTTGEYLPAPYIERFYIEDYGWTIAVSIFMPDDDKMVASAGAEVTDDTATLEDLQALNYYVIIVKNWNEDNDPINKVISGEVSALEYYLNIAGSDSEDDIRWVGQHYSDKIYPMDQTPVEYYDDTGKRFWKYTTTWTANHVEDDEFSVNDNIWTQTDDMAVFVFATPLDVPVNMNGIIASYDEIRNGEAPSYDWGNNPSDLMVRTQISDVAYERIFENYEIANRYQAEYMDADDAIYDQTPLQALNSFYYKIDTMTHQDIVDYFQELIDEFNAEYEVTNYPKLETMLNNLALVLQTFGEKAQLIPQLNALRQVTPDKAPTAPIGKLYKRFRKRIATTNKAIKEGEKLRRIVLFNGKIVDLRTPAVGTQDLGYQDLEDEEVLYTDWAAVHTRMEDWAYDGDDDWYGGIIAGTFLFDYEKALRRNSNISKILNIDKLEENGIHIPYDSFRVTEASVTRAGDSSLVDVVDCSITSLEDEDKDYPTTGTVEWHDWGIEMGYEDYQMMVINAPAEGEPWASALYCTEYASTPTSRLIVRNIVNPVASGPWSGTSLNTTGDTPYRLVGFEVIDYVTEYGEQIIAGDFDGDMYNEYLTRVTIKDSTATLIEVIITEVNDYVSALQEYYDLCVQECAINETSETFNTFFSEGILAAYEDDMENAPWVATPVAYVYFMDVATDLYAGDSDAMATAAAEIIQQINPVNGTLEAIESFLEFFNGFSETYLDISTLTTALDDDYSEKTYEVNLTIPHPNYLTSFDSSCADECDDATDCDGYPLASCIGGKCVAEEEEEEAEVTEKWDSWDSLQINKGSKKWDDASTTLLTEWFNVECGWWIPEYISVDTTDRQNQDYLSFLGILAEIEGMYERPTSTTSDWPWEGSSITPELEGWDLTARTGAGAMFFRRKLNSDGSEVDEAFHFWFDTASDSDYKCEFHAQRWKWYVVTEVDGTIISDEYGTSDYTGANEVTLCADEYLGCVERYGYSNESLMVCWVAEELYGKDDYRTHLARLYANTHDSWFLRAYQKYGVEWANWLKRHTWAKPLVRPIWDRMARLGKEIIVDSPNALGGK